MDERENRSRLDQAADWFVRRDSGRLSPREGDAFQHWLADPANRRAWNEIERTWSVLDVASRHGASPVRSSGSPWVLSGRRAAAIAATIVLVAFAYVFDVQTRLAADGYTAVGEVRTMALPDGSSVVLNTASAMAVDFSPSIRRVRLLRGEAAFNVAKDVTRPFVVVAAGGEVRALGTVFSVRHGSDDVRVTVVESRVGVSFPAGGIAAVELSTGEAAEYRRGGIGAVQKVDAEAETAWRRGKLVFVNRPLGSVIEELNRYHFGRIQITDSSISQHLVSGVFDLQDPLRMLDAIEQSLGLRSTRLTSYLVLLHR
jgi:transmembrane sensor